MTEADDKLAKQLWAIGDAVRIRILARLPDEANCQQGNNVSGLAEELGLAQPTVSHHLRVLRQAGLVSYRKMCRDAYYWIDREAAREVLSGLQDTLRLTAEAELKALVQK